MNRFLVFAVGLSFLGSGFGQERTKSPEKPKIVLEKVWEMKFDGEIVDIVMPNEEEAKKIIAKGKIPKPKAILLGKGILFFDENGRLMKKYKPSHWCSVKKSPKGRFIGLTVISKFGIESVREGVFKMLDENGKKLWEFKMQDPRIGSRLIIPSPNGEYAIGSGAMGDTMIFFHSKGIVKDFSRKFGTMNFEVAFSKDGKSCIAFFDGDIFPEPIPGNLVLFDSDGNVIWKKEMKIIGCDGLALSDDGKIIAFVGWEKLPSPTSIHLSSKPMCLFDINGNLLWKKYISLVGSYQFNFSKNSKYLLATGRDCIYMFEVSSGRILWEYKFSNPNRRFNNVAVTPNLDLILLSGVEIIGGRGRDALSTKKEFLLIFQNKRKVWEKEFAPGYFFRYYGRLPIIEVLSKDLIMILTKKGLEYFKIEKK